MVTVEFRGAHRDIDIDLWTFGGPGRTVPIDDPGEVAVLMWVEVLESFIGPARPPA